MCKTQITHKLGDIFVNTDYTQWSDMGLLIIRHSFLKIFQSQDVIGFYKVLPGVLKSARRPHSVEVQKHLRSSAALTSLWLWTRKRDWQCCCGLSAPDAAPCREKNPKSRNPSPWFETVPTKSLQYLAFIETTPYCLYTGSPYTTIFFYYLIYIPTIIRIHFS